MQARWCRLSAPNKNGVPGPVVCTGFLSGFGCASRSDIASVLTQHWVMFHVYALQVLKLSYDMEVLEEDAIIMWADEKQMATEDDRKYLKKAAAFVSWLREAEAEGSTSDDSE